MSVMKRMKRISAGRLRFYMNLYPPLLFNRVVLRHLSADFMQATVVIRKSLLNTNMNGTIFGGTLACAADPWHGTMLWNILARRDQKIQVWVRAAEMDYRKAAATDLTCQIVVTEDEIRDILEGIYARGKHVIPYVMDFKDKAGDVCASAKVFVYVRKIPEGEGEMVGF